MPDYPPLLSPGFHEMTLEGLHRFAVEDPRFKRSTTRLRVMKNLWTVAACLCRHGIHGEIWIDGSFLTEKIDPPDVDCVIVVADWCFATFTPEQESIMDWLCEDNDQPAKEMFSCDTYGLYVPSATDPGYADYLTLDAYWKSQFGMSREKQPKGMALVKLPDGCI